MTEEVDGLDKRLDDQEKAQVRIDIRALPVVVAGLFLTTFPDWLVRLPMIGTVALGLDRLSSSGARGSSRWTQKRVNQHR